MSDSSTVALYLLFFVVVIPFCLILFENNRANYAAKTRDFVHSGHAEVEKIESKPNDLTAIPLWTIFNIIFYFCDAHKAYAEYLGFIRSLSDSVKGLKLTDPVPTSPVKEFVLDCVQTQH